MEASNFILKQQKLARLWFLLSGLLLIIMLVQILSGKYSNYYLDAGSWFSQTVIPTLSVITTALVYTNIKREKFINRKVDEFYYKAVRNISIFYFLLIFLIIAMQSTAYKTIGLNGLELLQTSSFFLGLLQGLLNAFIGIFFIKSED